MGDGRIQTWVVLVDIRPEPEHVAAWTTAHGGHGGAIAWAAAHARDEGALRGVLAEAAAEQGWLVRDVDDVARWPTTGSTAFLQELVAELQATGDRQVVWGPLQIYPDEDLSDPDFLAEMARVDGLTPLQVEVVETMADMLARVDLPRLDGASFHLEDDDAVVALSPVDERDHELVVAVGDATVDVDYGWAHEIFDVSDDDGLDTLYQFLLSALQGGVKVKVFRSWGRIRKVQTYVLMDGETWRHAYTMGMFIPPGFRDPPPTTHLFGFN